MTDQLTSFAPVLESLEQSRPTGNLRIALPELDNRGRLLSIGVLSEAERGVVTGHRRWDAPFPLPSTSVASPIAGGTS